MIYESAFTMDTSSIKYGPGVTREVGHDMKNLGATRVLVVTDPNLSGSEPVKIACDALRAQGIDVVLFDQARIEPTDHSFKEVIDFAVDGEFDGYVAVGGGSTMDTAKAANLYATYPAAFLDYVNPPIGMIFGQIFSPEPDFAVCKQACELMHEATGRIEAALDTSPFLVRDTPCAADVIAAPFVRLSMLPEGAGEDDSIMRFFSSNLHLGEGRERTRDWVQRVVAFDPDAEA